MYKGINRSRKSLGQYLELGYQSAEPLIEEPSKEEVEVAIGKLRSYKTPGTDYILGELIKACGEAGVSKYFFR